MDLDESRPGLAEIIAILDAPRPSLTSASSLLARANSDVVSEALQRWVRRSDAPEQLLRRGWADGWLWPAVEAVWADSDDGPVAERRAESMLWVALSSLGGRFSGLTFMQAKRIRAFAADPRLHRGKVHEHQRRVMDSAVEAFHDPYVQKRTLQFGGWLYILSAAADVKFRGRDHVAALALAQEAWGFRQGLPPGLQSAKVFVHVASQIATVSAYMRDSEAMSRLQEALTGLDEAERLLDAAHAEKAAGARGAMEHLTLALSRENVYRRMSIWRLIPFLDSVEQGSRTLAAGFERFRELTGLPPLADLASGGLMTGNAPPSTHPTVAHLLMRLAHCASRSGDWSLSTQAISAAGRFSSGDVQKWDWAIATAFNTGDRSQLLDLMERLLRFAENSAGIAPQARGVLLARSANVARDASRAFYREKLFTSSWFWMRIAVEWDERARSGSAAVRGATTSDAAAADVFDDTAPAAGDHPMLAGEPTDSVPADADQDSDEFEAAWAEPQPKPGRTRVTAALDRVRDGVPLAVVLSLFRTGKQLSSPGAPIDLSGVMELVAAVDGWRRPRRVPVEKPTPVDPHDVGTVQRWMLASASELAAVYAPHLLPEIHLAMSSSPHLDVASKLSHARLCSEYAREAGRPNYISAGLFNAVKIAISTGDAAVIATQVGELVDAIGSGRAWSPRGADLVETAYWSGRRTEKLIEILLRSGYPEFATRLFDSNVGRLHHSFRSVPAFAAELQLMERTWGTRSPDDEDELFRRIRARILEGEVVSIEDPGAVPGASVLLAADEVVVRLLAFGSRSWALLSVPVAAGVRFEAVELEIGEDQVSELSDLIWYQLRPTRASKPATALRVLHDVVVAPILERIPADATLIFHPQGAMSTLPLHAALGTEGYAIEHRPIAYYPTDRPEQPDQSSRRWLVCGWDVSAHAEREAREVARVLRRRGHAVELPPDATQGLTQLLSPSGQIEMVHVAGHGQSAAWPRSFQSTIALSPRIQLTAADWLTAGPRAAFVFLNVCGVGRVKPYGGDLNGFPLALRIRGAQAIIAANGFIPPTDAHRFAERFYAHLDSDDSLTAYRNAVRESIEAGVAAGGWAPYAHFGRGYRLGGERNG